MYITSLREVFDKLFHVNLHCNCHLQHTISYHQAMLLDVFRKSYIHAYFCMFQKFALPKRLQVGKKLYQLSY